MLKIHISPQPYSMNDSIFIYEQDGDKIDTFYFDKDGNCTVEHSPANGAEIKPSLVLRNDVTRSLIQAFMELGQKRGIELDSDSKAKGKLEAMERHLSDLRHLLKLK